MRFALARLGAVLVPINFMLKASEVAFILRHAGVTMLATDTALSCLARDSAALNTAVRDLLWLPGEEPGESQAGMLSFDDLAACRTLAPASTLDGADLAQILYTSGTESTPKGAMLAHDAVMWQYVSCIVDAGIAAEDIALHSLPLYHCAQLDVFFGPSIYVGATNIITGRPVPENLLAMMARYRVSSFFAPPTVWISLLRSPLFDATDLSALRKGYYGASIMPVEVLHELVRRLPNVRFWNLYGQTEIAPLATMLGPEDQLRKPGSCGRPVLNVETRVVDESMCDVAPGMIGEIVHRSPHLMHGYLNDDERTAMAFHGDWFHSGDLATVDSEGYITIVDRKKDMIKTGSENVYSPEVESMLCSHPAVLEAAVIGVPDPTWGEAIRAVVVPRPGAAVSEAEVISWCRDRLTHFKCPTSVVFTDALPKGGTGKVQKNALRERFGAQAPAS